MRRFLVESLALLLPLTISTQVTIVRPRQSPTTATFKLSSAYAEGGRIPAQYTCSASNASSPALQWSNTPSGTMSFGLIFHDLDGVPASGTGDITHWVVWNIAANSTQLPAGVPPDASPGGIQQGDNAHGANGYHAPCPAVGAGPHHYLFELYALDTKLDLPAGASRAALLKAMDGHILGKATLAGVFVRESAASPGTGTP